MLPPIEKALIASASSVVAHTTSRSAAPSRERRHRSAGQFGVNGTQPWDKRRCSSR